MKLIITFKEDKTHTVVYNKKFITPELFFNSLNNAFISHHERSKYTYDVSITKHGNNEVVKESGMLYGELSTLLTYAYIDSINVDIVATL